MAIINFRNSIEELPNHDSARSDATSNSFARSVALDTKAEESTKGIGKTHECV